MRSPRRKPAARLPPRLPDDLDVAELPRDDLVDDALIGGVHFGGTDLSGRRARLVDVEECRFDSALLADGEIERLSLTDSRLERCDLANLRLDRLALTRVELTGCRMTGLTAPAAALRQVLLRDCVADLVAFRFATLTHVELVDCRLTQADFGSADLRGSTFVRCDLSRAELSEVQADGAVFVDCSWDGVRGVASLRGATVAHSSPMDALAFTAVLAGALGIRLADPADLVEGLPD